MDPIDLPKNMLMIAFQIDMEEGELSVMTQHNLEKEEMGEVEYQIQVDLLLGLQMMLDAAPELLIRQGLLQRLLIDTKEDAGPEIVFEPDEQLLDVLAEGKIVPFKKDPDPLMAKWAEEWHPSPPIHANMVDKPPHYSSANIECIEAMEAMSEGADIPSHQAYCWQNSFKYLWRWPYKNGLEDLKKCRWYLDRLIKKLEAER